WRAQVFGYDAAREEALLRNLLQLRLMVECVQILTPPLLTVKRIGDEEFDLIGNLHSLIRLLAFSLWGRLAAEESDLIGYGALSVCIAGLAAKPDEALAMLESGQAAAKGDPALFLKWFEKGSGRSAMDRVKTILRLADKHGLDDIFGLLTRHALDLGLQPVTIEFARQALQSLAAALSDMDGKLTDGERRHFAVLSAQFMNVSRQYAVDFAARCSDPGVCEEDLGAILKELDAMVGLGPVKAEVRRAANFARVQVMRRQQGLPAVQA